MQEPLNNRLSIIKISLKGHSSNLFDCIGLYQSLIELLIFYLALLAILILKPDLLEGCCHFFDVPMFFHKKVF